MVNGLSGQQQPSSSQCTDKGAYILLIENEACQIRTGALGSIAYKNGWHAYVGSALGSGGFARVRRHIRVNTEKNQKPRWHIDYLLISPSCTIRRVYCIKTTSRIECEIASGMDGDVIPGFGSSDCSCPGHLFYYPCDPHPHIQNTLERPGVSFRLYMA